MALATSSCKKVEPDGGNGGGSDEPQPKTMPAETGSEDVNDGYQLVWEDTFNGDALDPLLWNIEVNGGGGGNNELQYYLEDNVSIESDSLTNRRCLVLTARKQKWGAKFATSGRVNTLGKVAYTHGKVEALIRMPKTYKGLWPAFWMMGNDYKTVGWPRCGEIDILEAGNSAGMGSVDKSEKYFNGACHWGFYKDGAYPNYAHAVVNSYSVQDDFHLFTLIWDENAINCYVDYDVNPAQKPYYTLNIKDNGSDDDWATYKYFHKDFFIIFNLAVGGNFPGIKDIEKITALNEENGYEAKMYIDYVRVYQK